LPFEVPPGFPPDSPAEPEPESEAVSALGAAAGAALDVGAVPEVDDELPDESEEDEALPPEDPYPSAYQPPPFKMKPAPREICRLA
jgi:hypothetical protein